MSTTKKAGTTVRIRSVGPMTLTNCTEYELTQLRQAVSRPNSKVKYLALCKTDNNVQVVAQASHKLSTSAWRQCLSMRIAIRSNANIQDSIELFKKNPAINKSFEEFGVFGRHINDQANKTSSKAGDSSGEELEPSEIPEDKPKLKNDKPGLSSSQIKMYQDINTRYFKRLVFHKRDWRRKLNYTGPKRMDPDNVKLCMRSNRPPMTKAQVLDATRSAYIKRLCVHELEYRHTRSIKKELV